MRLLVTRPEPDGERTAQALRARGHAVVLAPLLRTEPVAFALPDQAFGAVVHRLDVVADFGQLIGELGGYRRDSLVETLDPLIEGAER